jgi:Leucine-rich repeat (LRR) protein
MKSHALLFCFLFAFSANLFTTAKGQIDKNDSLALVDLYNGTNGPEWKNHTNWLAKEPVSTWYGVGVTNARVTSLDLFFNNLSGTIPSSIGNLVNLSYLDLPWNNLSGPIPSSIGNLGNLTKLYLYNNQLSGTIPASISNCRNLRYLWLFGNQLSGSIPASIGNLENLEDLDLGGNQLSGSIPSSISNLAILSGLGLGNNQLSGSIPASIGNLIDLRYLVLFNNQLSDTIPASILVNLPYLRYLVLSNNQLSGSIPPIGNLKYILQLDLSNNQLSGAIPDSIGDLRLLERLYLNNNQLSGLIPFHRFRHLKVANLSHNQLAQTDNIEFRGIFHSHKDSIYVSYNHSTFNGLEYLQQSFPAVCYAPQDTILPVHQHGNTLAVTAGGTLSNNTYQWFKVGDANSTTIKGDSTFTPKQSGRYYVQVTNAIATQLTLFSDTIDITAPVTAQNRLAAESIKRINNKLSIYPNPAKDIIHVQIDGSATITLINVAGKVLLTKAITNKGEINVSTLANGTYYLQNKITGETQKVVIVH